MAGYLSKFEGFEVKPVRFISENVVEECEPSEAETWVIYGRGSEKQLEVVCDCETENKANAVRIAIEAYVRFQVRA
jgi:hypothetical protein